MPIQEHHYSTAVQWSGGRSGSGTLTATPSQTQLDIAVPTEFGGVGQVTNPEELLTSAVAGCYSITFGIIADNRKLPVQSFALDATGVVEQNGASLTFKSITLRPIIVLSPEATDQQVALAEDMSHKADNYCIVSNAVRDKVAITVEPTISR